MFAVGHGLAFVFVNLYFEIDLIFWKEMIDLVGFDLCSCGGVGLSYWDIAFLQVAFLAV